jgi:hypothetical protein
MRLGFLCAIGFALFLAIPGTASAQFGHPLHGQWSGGWGKAQENRLLLNLDWDGKQVTGVINPGPNQLTVTKTDIDYSNPDAWKIHMTAEGKDASGKAVSATIDGTLENIGVYYKVFRGTWTQGAQKADFLVTRN